MNFKKTLAGIVVSAAVLFGAGNVNAQDARYPNGKPSYLVPAPQGIGGGINPPRIGIRYPNGGYEQIRTDMSHGRPHINYDWRGVVQRMPHRMPLPEPPIIFLPPQITIPLMENFMKMTGMRYLPPY